MSETTHDATRYPTTAIEYGSNNPPSTHGGDSYQRRLVGNVHEGQVLVDLSAHEYDADKTTYEAYEPHRWDITHVSDDGRDMEMVHRETGETRELSVAELAHETIEEERWLFLKKSYAAPCWSRDMASTRCKNCGVNSDNALSREEWFDAEFGGSTWNVVLRRCCGCGMFGTVARREVHNRTETFTTGVIESDHSHAPPWERD